MPKHKIIYKDIINLIPYRSDTRTLGAVQRVQVVSTLPELGVTNPVLTDSDDCFIAWHHRIIAADHIFI